jgi:alginate O-acetyltransferase complex protein AlgI
VRDWRLRHGKRMTRQDRAKVGTFVAVVALPMMFTMFIAGIWHGAGVQFMVFGLIHGLYLSGNNAWRQFRRKRSPEAVQPGPIVAKMRRCLATVVTYLLFLFSLTFFRADSYGHAVSILASMFGFHRASLTLVPGVGINRAIVEIIAGMAIVWFLPNTQQILTRFRPSLQKTAWDQTDVPKPLLWLPTTGWAVGVGVLFFAILVELQQPSTFLYFQF